MKPLFISVLSCAVLFSLAPGCKSLVSLKLPPPAETRTESDWMMLGRNLQRQHFTLLDIAPPLEMVWQKKVKSVVADHPLALGDVIFAPAVNGFMYLVDYHSGEGITTIKLGPSLKGVPSIYQNTLYAGLTLGPESLLRFDLKSGERELSHDYPYITTSPLVVENKLYFGTNRNVFFCANRISGISIWEYITAAPVSSSAALSGMRVIFGDEKGWFYALDAVSGAELWKVRLEGSIFSHPVVDDSLAYLGTVAGKFYGIDLQDGRVRWMHSSPGSFFSSPALFEDALYVGNNAHEVLALDKRTGALLWKFKTGGIVNTTPLPSPHYLYFTSWDKNLYVVERQSGELAFTFPLRHASKSSPVIYRDLLLIHTANDALIALANEKIVENWRIEQ